MLKLHCKYKRKETFTVNIRVLMIRSKGKVKAIPLQAWTGPEGSRCLRLPDFKTSDT